MHLIPYLPVYNAHFCLECFQTMMFLRYFFVTTSAVFLPFFFFKYSPKIGVGIIHGRALYMGKYVNPKNYGTLVNSKF